MKDQEKDIKLDLVKRLFSKSPDNRKCFDKVIYSIYIIWYNIYIVFTTEGLFEVAIES